ncbi:MAG: ABC transporter permease [Rhodobacteraceae bacterium]|nr:ABC transporter permease [Paracoccaceae bacterium]
MRMALGALLSHWLRRPGQLLTLMAGLALATALWSGVQALNQQARDSYDRAASMFGGPGAPVLIAKGGGKIDQAVYVALRRAGWPVSPVLEGRVRLDLNESSRRLRVIGVEPLTTPSAAAETLFGDSAFSGAAEAQGEPFDFVAFVTPPGLAYAAPETLTEIGLPPEGGVLRTTGGLATPPLRPRAALAPGVLVMDIGAAQRLLRDEGALSRLLLDAEALERIPPQEALDAVTSRLDAPQLRHIEPQEEGDLARLTDSFHLNLTAFGMLSFLVGLFIVHGAIGLAFEQRLGTIRTLRAIGVSGRLLSAALLIELLGAAVIAGLIGAALGYLVAAALLPDVAATLRGLYGAAVGQELELDPSWWAAGVAMSVGGALLAAAQSLVKTLRAPVLAAAQPAAWRATHRRWTRGQAFAGVSLLCSSAALTWAGDGLITAFTALAGLMLGAALLLPWLLDSSLTLGERLAAHSSRQPVAPWFWADGRQQLSALSLALMALMLALSANIGVGTMVESFRTTFTAWLDKRLAAEIYISPEDPAQAAEIITWLRSDIAAAAGVTAVLPSGRATTQVQGWPASLVGVEDHATYRSSWPFVASAPDAWDAVAAEQGVLVSEQLARRLDLWVGDALPLAAPNQTPNGDWAPRIVGVYPDYGAPNGEITLSNAALKTRWGPPERVLTAARAAPERVEALVAEIRSRFELDETRVLDQGALKRFSTRVFNRTFAITSALNALTLGVAAVALLTSLSALADMRLPQLAPLWAMGLTRRRLARLELLKTLALALFTAVLAIPLGLALAWGLVAVVNVEAFGWRLPLHLFPLQWLEAVALAALAALLAAAWPAQRLARTPPARLLRVFAEER